MSTMKLLQRVAYLVLLSALYYGPKGGLANIDPCLSTEHKILKDSYRSTGFDLRSTDTPKCDNQLAKGWYRFQDLNGASITMPTTCPGRNRCGTVAPYWMSGSLPSVAKGIVNVMICAKLKDDPAASCCESTDTIFMKNCGKFYVYNLLRTETCSSGYCAGNIIRCTVDQHSPTGFEPCKDRYPILKDLPVLKGPIISTDQTFEFRCEVKYVPNDAGQRFEITWTFNGNPDPNIQPTILADTQREAVLSGEQMKAHFNKDIGCQVQTYYIDTQNDKSPIRTTNTIVLGVKVNPGSLFINVQDTEKELTVTSTIPVCSERQNCCVTYKLRSTRNFVVTLKDTCELKICSKDWDPDIYQAVFNITVVPFRNDIGSGNDKLTTLSFDSISLTGSGPYIDILKNYKPNPVPITVKLENGSKCAFETDPHVKGFDYPHYYHFFHVGEYTAYEVKDRDFEVQVKTGRCAYFNAHVSCVCGVIVREKNNIIKVNGCDFPGHAFSAPVVSAYKLDEGTVVLRSGDNKQISILLTSGSEIIIDLFFWGMNVVIKTPAFDNNKARGLCGTNDHNPENDFTHRDGSITSLQLCSQPSECFPNDFVISWSVEGRNSLFHTIPAHTTYLATTSFCACDANMVEKADKCSSSQYHGSTADVCKNCQPITDKIPIEIWGQVAQVPIVVSSDKQWSDDTDAADVDFIRHEQNFAEIMNMQDKRLISDRFWNNEYMSSDERALNTIPNIRRARSESITKDQAREMCENSVRSSQLYNKCQGIDNMFDNALINCMEDILAGGTTEMLDSAISSFTTSCQITLANDPINYKENEDGSVVLMSEIIEDVCPIECRKHGKCGAKGKCLCKAGWEGNTCHIETGKGPQIVLTTSHSTCHADNKICDSVDLMVTNINLFDKLQCQVFTLNALNEKNNKPVIKPALNEASPIAICGLPQTGVSSQNFTVSVTKDGTLFSNELRVQTYDSLCLNCRDSGCVEKETACHIDNICYKHNQIKPKDVRLMCNTTKDTTAWSQNPNSGIITTPISWIMILATALILVTSVSN